MHSQQMTIRYTISRMALTSDPDDPRLNVPLGSNFVLNFEEHYESAKSEARGNWNRLDIIERAHCQRALQIANAEDVSYHSEDYDPEMPEVNIEEEIEHEPFADEPPVNPEPDVEYEDRTSPGTSRERYH